MSNWRKRNQEKWDEYIRGRKYGLKPGEYESMYGEQRGMCAICDKHELKLAIDHDHYTGKVRGLLCRRCNLMLGMAKDDPETLISALNYLIENKAEQSEL